MRKIDPEEKKRRNRIYQHEYYIKNKEQKDKQNKLWQQTHRLETRLYRRQWKAKKPIVVYIRTTKESNPCSDCKQFYPYYVMDFDHIQGQKLFKLGDAHQQNKTMQEVQQELSKCELVCANCHRVRSWKRLQDK